MRKIEMTMQSPIYHARMVTLFKVTIMLVVMTCLPALARAEENLTIGQIISQVVRSNNRAEAARFMEQSARENIGAQGKWPDPMLMVGIQNTPTSFDFSMDPMTMRTVGISQAIPYSGYLGFQKKAAKLDAESARAERYTIEIDLVMAARYAYLDLFYQQQLIIDLEGQRDLLEQLVNSVTAKYRANQATHDEVLSAQSNQWRLESMILSAHQELDAARFSLNALRGAPVETAVLRLAEPPSTDLPTSADGWFDLARTNYPPLRRLMFKAESYRFSAAASRRMTWPMLNLQAEYGFRSGFETDMLGNQGEPRDNMISLQASISLPIFSRGQQKNMARSMDAMQQSNTLEAEQLQRDTESALHSLFERAVRLQQSIDLYAKRILPTSEDAYRSALSGFSASRSSFSSLLSYQIAILNDKTTLTQLRAEFARTLAEVARYTTDPSQWESASTADSKG